MRQPEKLCWFRRDREGPPFEKYPNKLDYPIKFKEFLDHCLKGALATDWMTTGSPCLNNLRGTNPKSQYIVQPTVTSPERHAGGTCSPKSLISRKDT